MTLTTPEPARLAENATLLRAVPEERLELLTHYVLQALDADDTDVVLLEAVTAVLNAFVEADGVAATAATQAAPFARALGARHARLGRPDTDLRRAFNRVGTALQRGLPAALDGCVAGHAFLTLREQVASFLSRVFVHAHRGWDQTRGVMTMSQDARMTELRTALFGNVAELDDIVDLAGFDCEELFVPIASVGPAIAEAILRHPSTIAGPTPTEVIVPAEWEESALLEGLATQLVLGPPRTLDRIAPSVGLVRRSAALLRSGRIHDERLLIPCTDLLGPLIVGGDEMLADLLIEKHLRALLELSPIRRLDLARLLLATLERPASLAVVAKSLGVAPQTAHSRMKVLKKHFGSRLEDPLARLELVIALSTAIPRWSTGN